MVYNLERVSRTRISAYFLSAGLTIFKPDGIPLKEPYDTPESRGTEPIFTDVESLDKAVILFLAGELVNPMEK
jgi:hypothetical protein